MPKRGDIGNTSKLYARGVFEHLQADAVTVAPLWARTVLPPFLGYPGKWVVLLHLASNKGSHDFQFIQDSEGHRLFENVILASQKWASSTN